MTKRYICGKMIFMKKLALKSKTLIILLSILMVASIFVAFYPISEKVFAQSGEKIQAILPKDKVEYYDFTTKAPYKATRFDGGVAIITDNTDNPSDTENLWIYTEKEGKYVQYDKFGSDELLQVYSLDKNTLIVNAQYHLYKVDLTDLTKEPVQLLDKAFDDFSINANYLVARAGTSISIYKKINGKYIEQDTLKSIVVDKTPIAINENNQLFYISNSTELTVRTIANENGYIKQGEIKGKFFCSIDSSLNAIIANNEYVYWLNAVNNTIYRANIESTQSTNMSVSSNGNFDLGALKSPTSLAFYNDNLIVSDSNLKAIQEFEINGNSLTFTGFAVAKDKTAFNRISENPLAVDRYQDNLVVLDRNKLTVIKMDENFDSLSRECFKNYSTESLSVDSYIPDMIAVGTSAVLLGYPNDTLKLLSLNSDELVLTDAPEIQNSLQDVYYSRGKFYVICTSGEGTIVTTFNEKGEDLTSELIPQIFANKLAVDLLGNVYLYFQNRIYVSSTAIADISTGLTDFNVDLCGNLYAIVDKSIVYYNETLKTWETAYTSSSNITTMSLNYDQSVIYFTNENCEVLYSIELNDSVKNSSINNVSYPTDLDTHKQTTDGDFKAYTVSDGAFIGSVKLGEKLVFNGLSDESEFIFLSAIEIDTVNGKKEFALLAGVNGLAFTYSQNLTEKQITTTALDNKTVYVTTPVHAYALPIITIKNDYAMQQTANSKLQVITLTKGTVLVASSSFNFLGQDFYYASVSDGNNTYTCYIPQSFTVDVLAEDVLPTTYSFVNLDACKLYKDADLSQEILDISEGTQVRLYSNDGKVCKVMVKVNGEYIEGYVSSTYLSDTPNTAVRNILIVLAVVACFCGSTTFFLLRKKA